ncbi:hypothetical protein K469DRAFT_747042 [Zopfia rhizophila CBS 207.26]|uniref:Uncharacterized protein n=1 Tax=Zopfia rhizophila CBS 207.26 TaxID=1314779 RepID=A0A6A6EIU9_9PEZI|nr:hypothetical protein K469DRAFT_747042 [Zopfia rhizophila CBS 207.26]
MDGSHVMTMADAPQLAYPNDLELDHERNSSNLKQTLATEEQQAAWFVVILTVIIIATAVGRGVGGSLAVQNAKLQLRCSYRSFSLQTEKIQVHSDNARPPLPATYVPPAPTTVSRVDAACPPSGIVKSDLGQPFKCSYGLRYLVGDLAGLTAYSL